MTPKFYQLFGVTSLCIVWWQYHGIILYNIFCTFTTGAGAAEYDRKNRAAKKGFYFSPRLKPALFVLIVSKRLQNGVIQTTKALESRKHLARTRESAYCKSSETHSISAATPIFSFFNCVDLQITANNRLYCTMSCLKDYESNGSFVFVLFVSGCGQPSNNKWK